VTPFWRRHLIASVISFVMVTGWLAILGSFGMLGAIVPADQPWERSILGGMTLTLGLFFPWAAMAEWIGRATRLPLWVPPLLLMLAVATCGIVVELFVGSFHPSFILTFLTIGLIAAVMFCGYWVPLQMGRRAGEG